MVKPLKHSLISRFRAIDRLAEPWEAAEFAKLRRDTMRPGGTNKKTGRFEPGTPYTQCLVVIVNLRQASPVTNDDLEYPEEVEAREAQWEQMVKDAREIEPSEDSEPAKYAESREGMCFGAGCENDAEPSSILCTSCKDKQRLNKKRNKELCSVPGCDRKRQKSGTSYCEEHRKLYHRIRNRRFYAAKALQENADEGEISCNHVLSQGLVERTEGQ